MKAIKTYYHIIEYGDYGKIGHQGYYNTIEEANAEVKRLSEFFPKLHFEVFVSNSKKEPPITTV